MADWFEQRVGDTERRVAVLEQIAADIRALRDRMDKRLDQTDDRLTVIDAHHCAEFWWMIGVMLACSAGLLAEMACGFHWS